MGCKIELQINLLLKFKPLVHDNGGIENEGVAKYICRSINKVYRSSCVGVTR